MLAHVPTGAKVLIVSGGSGAWLEDLRTRGGAAGGALVATWDLRTRLDEEEAKVWAARAALSQGHVWVCFFHDGGLAGSVIDEPSGRPGFADWSFEVIKYAGFLLAHGAHLVYTADDAFNPSFDAAHPGLVFPEPGPGMFATMMHKLMYPRRSSDCCGKGGSAGHEFMMERARQMLIAQGHSGDPHRIMMVGDRFDTDGATVKSEGH